MTTYPVHTPIVDIKNFDRSIKVEFECMTHPDVKWISKDPFVSHVFAAPSNSTVFGDPVHDCDCPWSNHWTSTEYTA